MRGGGGGCNLGGGGVGGPGKLMRTVKVAH